jgi:hypothetical protein
MNMNKKATLKDWMLLLATGVGMTILFYGAIAVVALLVGLLVAKISDVSWLIASLFINHPLRWRARRSTEAGRPGKECREPLNSPRFAASPSESPWMKDR